MDAEQTKERGGVALPPSLPRGCSHLPAGLPSPRRALAAACLGPPLLLKSLKASLAGNNGGQRRSRRRKAIDTFRVLSGWKRKEGERAVGEQRQLLRQWRMLLHELPAHFFFFLLFICEMAELRCRSRSALDGLRRTAAFVTGPLLRKSCGIVL